METAEVIATRVGDLPTLPHVATKVMELLSADDSNAGDLERMISRDQAITARVLKLANSALFGRRGMISTLTRAIVLLGFKTVQSLVIAASTETLYRTTSARFKDKLLWEHAVAAALAAGFVARECRYASFEEAFTAGLLHDIGKVVLDQNLPEPYQEVVELVYNDEVTFLEAEHKILGFDHAEVGALVVKKWNLPAPLEEAVRLHHRPLQSLLDPPLCAIVSLGNSICIKLGLGPERQSELALEGLEAVRRLKLPAERLPRIMEMLQEKLAQEKELFNLT
jgi:putative nucleotidyltransferase with HDIG domain